VQSPFGKTNGILHTFFALSPLLVFGLLFLTAANDNKQIELKANAPLKRFFFIILI
jgi:hypothetical protein